jgi:hypothetical protein
MASKPKKPSPIRIGLLGESPNDTVAIQGLLRKQFGDRLEFVTLLDDVTGSQLDDAITPKLLRFQFQLYRPRIVVVIRDLDGRENDFTATRRQRLSFFRRMNTIVEQRGIYLLNICSIEALLLADADVINDHYGCRCVVEVDPAHIDNPSDVLAHVTSGRYAEGHCRELFPQLRYDRLIEVCDYFAKFHHEFTARLTEPRPVRR